MTYEEQADLLFSRGLECDRDVIIAHLESIIMTSWLHAINAVRNMCAHHARLWNRTLGFKPVVPRGDADWDFVRSHNDKIFAILSILNYLLARIAPDTKWQSRLCALLDEYPQIDVSRMGFPKDWKTSLLIRRPTHQPDSP